MSGTATIRLYVEHPVGPGQSVPLSQAQAHYLFHVMRRGVGDPVEVFDGRNGAWIARIDQAERRGGRLSCQRQVAPQRMPPDLWLVFAPIKKTRTDFMVEKAAEMGVRRILPVMTDHTNAQRLRRDRLQAHAIEAAEQCGGTFVPEVAELGALSRLLDSWPPERALMWCDEALAMAPAAAGPEYDGPAAPHGACGAVLIGPEGGFSAGERARLAALPFARATRLGPRILRADTAAVAALTLWQLRHGDWNASRRDATGAT